MASWRDVLRTRSSSNYPISLRCCLRSIFARLASETFLTRLQTEFSPETRNLKPSN